MCTEAFRHREPHPGRREAWTETATGEQQRGESQRGERSANVAAQCEPPSERVLGF